MSVRLLALQLKVYYTHSNTFLSFIGVSHSGEHLSTGTVCHFNISNSNLNNEHLDAEYEFLIKLTK